MKKAIIFISSLLLCVLFFVQNSCAQNTAIGIASDEASVSATIITPLTIAHAADLVFGSLNSGSSERKIVVDPLSTSALNELLTLDPGKKSEVSATITGENSGPELLGSSAVYFVSGQPGASYSITLPTEIIIKRIGGSGTMRVTNFTSSPGIEGRLDANGKQTISVGATLNIGAGQIPGEYSTGGAGFNIMLSYY